MTPRLFVVVGSPGSGKDLLIRAVNDLGSRHAKIVPKHSDRELRRDEGNEMYFPGDSDYNMESCDVLYENYGDKYGIVTSDIWESLYKGFNQVVVVSNLEAINKIKDIFGSVLVLVYVHSVISPEQFIQLEGGSDLNNKHEEYIAKRSDVSAYHAALDFYTKNISAFNHVLINSGTPEDLYDQLFRLFESYKCGGQ